MDTTKRRMTRSPVALARTALQVSAKALPAYASKYSKKQFTQHQLFAMLVLKQFFRTDYRGVVELLKDDYRGVVELLKDLSDLRRVLGLAKVPDHSTLFYAQKRLVKKGLSTSCSARCSTAPARAA